MKFQKYVSLVLAVLMLLSMGTLASCDGGENEKTTYGVTLGTVSVEIDAEAEAILAALGAWKTYDASPTCAFEGEDKVYGYGSFDIQTYTADGKDYIHSIYLLDDAYATRKGISVGSTREAVITAYGDPNEESATALTYNADGMVLSFLLRDGTVTNIQYVKVVAD